MTYLDMKQLRYCLQKKKWFWKINPENHFHSYATRTSLPNSISIHDTLAGIDRYPQSAGAAGIYFNPRYPRRYRHGRRKTSVCYATFQSTIPSQVSTPKLHKNISFNIKLEHNLYIFFTYHNSLCPLYNYTFLFFVQHFRCESPIDWMCTSHSHYTNINTFQTSFQLLSIDHFNLTTTKGNISTNVENLCCIEQRSKRRQVTFECLYFILFLSLLNTSEIRLGT